MEILPTILAHTGNDAVNHGFELADGIIGGIIIISVIIGIYLFKKHRKLNNNQEKC